MLESAIKFANDVLWGKLMVGLIILTGIIYTVKLEGIQFTRMGEAVQNFFGSGGGGKNRGISPYEAFSTALAGTMGTGNIVGVAAAISVGGAGAVFWMWVSSALGMIIKYAEVFLSVKYSSRVGTERSGGPMYYIRDGLGLKWLSVIFAIGTILASFGIGNITQVGAITNQLYDAYGVPHLTAALILCIPIALVVLFGYERTGKVTAKLVPIMGALYIAMAVCVLWTFAENIPWAFAEIFGSAFGTGQALGGTLGWSFSEAVRMGFARGLFSNEAGLGSSPIAHGSADGYTPDRQGLLGIFEVFVDTAVICTITALVILVTLRDNPQLLSSAVPVTQAVKLVLGGNITMALMSIIITCFAYSSVISWCFYGCKSTEFLFGKGRTLVYRVLFVAVVALGSVLDFSAVWEISDVLNIIMAAPNLIALLTFALSKENVFRFVAVVALGSVLDFSAVWEISDVLNIIMAAPNLIALLTFALSKENVFRLRN